MNKNTYFTVTLIDGTTYPFSGMCNRIEPWHDGTVIHFKHMHDNGSYTSLAFVPVSQIKSIIHKEACDVLLKMKIESEEESTKFEPYTLEELEGDNPFCRME